ncbi:hypothetical protein SCOR_19435 [Sulfidibacter corallicola]|uniref:Uncharacterized protein n=1 Tax=Sulfidibacter corallicola TaxID=2818388 RepID=A0A8A4TW30_SULCO|nr:hypothetical protein [Sulfidibacter corallicola]QTD53381.1 hypothetical protein J3U87_13080 [Sulfidibacter corallicola]
MRYLLICILALGMVACFGPRPFSNVHFLSLPETNQGRALPVHVIPVDESLRVKLERMTAEDWFISDDVNTLTGIQKRVLRGAQNEVVQAERRNDRNDFMVIVDFADVEGADQQKLVLGDKHYRAKDIYVLVERDRIRVVSKSVYDDYLRSR